MSTKPRPGPKSASGWAGGGRPAAHHEDEEVAPGTTIGQYKLGEKLGKGAFATVYKALDTDSGDFVAIKRISKQKVRGKAQQQRVLAEGQLMKRLDHPNITKFRDVVETTGHLHFVLEYIDSGSLASLVAKYGVLSEKLCILYLRQVLEGLCYLHAAGICHRDIKQSNNLLVSTSGVVKVSDFGIAHLVESQSDALKTLRANKTLQSDDEQHIGSPYWMAPEVVMMLEATPASDIWSTGCTAIELCTGKPPYFELSTAQACFRMVEDEHPPFPAKMSPGMSEFMHRAFVKDYKLRPSAKELLQIDWFKPAAKPAEGNNNNSNNNNNIDNGAAVSSSPAPPVLAVEVAPAPRPQPALSNPRLSVDGGKPKSNRLSGAVQSDEGGAAPPTPPPMPMPAQVGAANSKRSGKRACYKCDGRLGTFSSKSCKGCKFVFCKKCCAKDTCVDCVALRQLQQHSPFAAPN